MKPLFLLFAFFLVGCAPPGATEKGPVSGVLELDSILPDSARIISQERVRGTIGWQFIEISLTSEDGNKLKKALSGQHVILGAGNVFSDVTPAPEKWKALSGTEIESGALKLNETDRALVAFGPADIQGHVIMYLYVMAKK